MAKPVAETHNHSPLSRRTEIQTIMQRNRAGGSSCTPAMLGARAKSTLQRTGGTTEDCKAPVTSHRSPTESGYPTNTPNAPTRSRPIQRMDGSRSCAERTAMPIDVDQACRPDVSEGLTAWSKPAKAKPAAKRAQQKQPQQGRRPRQARTSPKDRQDGRATTESRGCHGPACTIWRSSTPTFPACAYGAGGGPMVRQ